MKRRPLPWLLVALTATATVAAATATAATAAGNPARVGRYIVVLRDSVGDPSAVANAHARGLGARVSHVYRFALKGYAAAIPSDRLAKVRADSRVAFVSEDRPVQAAAQTLPTGVNRIEADASSQAAGNGSNPSTGPVHVRVAVIDTGSGPHSDLNVVGGKNCSTGSSYNDGNGHGTHVAGTIGARDDSAGVVGVAPAARTYSVRSLNKNGSGTWSSVICGIDWVTNTGAHPFIAVANMSLGGSGADDGNCGNTNNDALHKAICRSVAAGTTYVVAAGNGGTNFSGTVPAAYNEVLTVTAEADFNGQPGGGAAPTCRSDVDETPADFSNYTLAGSPDESHTIAAPGACIYSTWKGGGYSTISGTSMATPHAAGSVALCLEGGSCAAGSRPSTLIAKLRSDAQAKSDASWAAHNADPFPVYYGYNGDPNSPIVGSDSTTRYYGYLLYDDAY